jgi:hypothetical protein
MELGNEDRNLADRGYRANCSAGWRSINCANRKANRGVARSKKFSPGAESSSEQSLTLQSTVL